MKKNNLPGIAVFAYNRPKHLQKTLDKLEKNYRASDLDFYLFCDGPKNNLDQKKIEQIYDIFDKIKVFKSKKIFRSKNNQGLYKSLKNGISKILKFKESVIIIEDDIISNKNFLDYMIKGLDFYKNEINVGSVSGYSYTSVDDKEYSKQTFLSQRHASWGWGTWRSVWEKMIWDNKKINKIINNDRKFKKKFNKSGPDMYHMLKSQIEGNLDTMDIIFNFNCFLLNKYCVCPFRSMVYNIGFDGSGIHCKKDEKVFSNFSNNFRVNKFEKLRVENKIINKIYDSFTIPFHIRVFNKLKKIFY